MTTEHEALTETTYRLAQEVSGMTREEVDAFYRTLGLSPSLHPAQTHIWLPGYRAGRAQVDEDVRRLVEAAAPFANISSCYCEDFWQDYGRQHGPNCVVDDLSPDIAALRAALEPFKAVGADRDH